MALLAVAMIAGQGFPAATLAATYYVSQTSGNDSNAGTSANAAWRNAPGMDAYAGSGKLAPGDTVYFNSSDTWLVTGTQGIYLVGGVTYIGNQWGGGARAVIRASANLGSAVVRFRDHATIATVFRGFDVDANRKVTNGIEMNHTFYAGPLTGATKRVDDVIVHHIWSSTVAGQYKYGIIVSNHGGVSGEVANVEILNSVIHDTSRDALPIYPGDENADCIVRNVTVRGNTVYNTGQDPTYGAGSGIIVKGRVIDAIVENNYVYGTVGAGIFINGNETNHFGFGPTNVHIRYNLVNVNTAHGSIRIYDGSSGKDPKEVNVYGNVVFNNTQGAGLQIDPDLGSTNALRVYNNTFYNASVRINNTAATFSVLDFKNNIVVSSSSIPLIDSGKIKSHANNLLFGNATLARIGGVSYSAGQLSTYEPTAKSADPMFLDPHSLPTGFTGTYAIDMRPNAAGLSLAAGSPAINAGAAMAAPFDRGINSQSRSAGQVPDIGAYESANTNLLPAPTNLRVVQ